METPKVGRPRSLLFVFQNFPPYGTIRYPSVNPITWLFLIVRTRSTPLAGPSSSLLGNGPGGLFAYSGTTALHDELHYYSSSQFCFRDVFRMNDAQESSSLLKITVLMIFGSGNLFLPYGHHMKSLI